MDQQAPPGQRRAGSTERGVLQLLNRLGDELGAGVPEEQQGRSQEWPPISMQREEDEALLVGFREGLARLAASRRREPGEGEPAVGAALDGAQLVARNKILMGHREELRLLLPAFAYLVILPIAGETEADRVSGRAAHLIAST